MSIVMLPFMSQGHLIPFLELAKRIVEEGSSSSITISIVNTPLNIQYLQSTISPTLAPHIHFVSLPYSPTQHGLPPNTENSETLTLNQRIDFIRSSTTLQTPFHSFISQINPPPLCIISDLFFSWAAEVAYAFGIQHFTFTTCGAYGTAAFMSLFQHLPHQFINNNEFSMPGFPETRRFHISQVHPFALVADGNDAWSIFFLTQLSLSLRSSGWLCNTLPEIESFGLDVLRNYIKLPVWCVGPLLPDSMLKSAPASASASSTPIFTRRTGKESGSSAQLCIEWLNLHPKTSVLYISFGSQNTITAANMMELALGLEQSGKPFIWAIRPPSGFHIKGEFRDEWLPVGFEERMAKTKKGLLLREWAPQLEILSHESTGAFLSHCGWNSVLESLSQGVPIIGWPMAAEQPFNSKMLMEELGVAIELTRGLQGTIQANDVNKVIHAVMDNQHINKKAYEIRDQIRASVTVTEETNQKGSSLIAMADFINAIRSPISH